MNPGQPHFQENKLGRLGRCPVVVLMCENVKQKKRQNHHPTPTPMDNLHAVFSRKYNPSVKYHKPVRSADRQEPFSPCF